MVVTRLDDPGDDSLADYRNVPDPELVARRGLFVAEGRLVVTRLLTASRFTTRSVLVTDTALRSIRQALDMRPDVPVYVVSQDVMNGILGFNIHRGCLALGERPAARDPQELMADARRVVALERIGNADNVGSIFRTSAAFGVDAVLLGPACADPLYRKAIRTSMGSALILPFAHAGSWPDTLLRLRDAGWRLVAMTPAAPARPLRDVAVAIRQDRWALVLGHEGEGLTPDALRACDHAARIAMAPGMDSLNVATAAAVALYEMTADGT